MSGTVMKKNLLIFLIIVFIAVPILYVLLGMFSGGPSSLVFQTTTQFYKFSIEQENYLNSDAEILGSNTTKLNFKGVIALKRLPTTERQKVQLTFIDISADSSIKLFSMSYPIKKSFNKKSIFFFVEEDGSIDEIYFPKNERTATKEILKNFVALFDWRLGLAKEEEDSFERTIFGMAQVAYSSDSEMQFKKSPILYTSIPYLKKIESMTQEINGIQKLTLDKSGYLESIGGTIRVKLFSENKSIVLNAKSRYSFVRTTLPPLETIPISRPQEILGGSFEKSSISSFVAKQISMKDTYRQYAKGFKLTDIKKNILMGNDNINWFSIAVAKLSLIPSPELFLAKLYSQLITSNQKAIVFDLLTSLGDVKSQKVMLEIISNTKSNYTQLIQRFSLLGSPGQDVVTYLQDKVGNIKTESTDILNRKDLSVLYAYGAVGEKGKKEENQVIYNDLLSIYEQYDDGEIASQLLSSLANTKNSGVERIATEALSSDDSNMRFAAISALVDIYTEESKDALIKTSLEDKDSFIASSAMKGLEKFSLSGEDYLQFIAIFEKNLPSEKVMAEFVGIIEKRLDQKNDDIHAFFVYCINSMSYSSELSSRMLHIVQLFP